MKPFANDMLPGDLFHPSEIIKDELEAGKCARLIW